MKLHIGCGKVNFGKDWVHIDQNKYSHVSFRDPFNLPFDEQSVDRIYSSYFLHRLTEEESIKLLREFKRVIKKGETIRLSVPDFFLISDKYIKSKLKIEQVNRFFDGSKQYLDFIGIQKLLLLTGFYAVKRIDVYKTPPPEEDLSCVFVNGENISLTIEAYG